MLTTNLSSSFVCMVELVGDRMLPEAPPSTPDSPLTGPQGSRVPGSKELELSGLWWLVATLAPLAYVCSHKSPEDWQRKAQFQRSRSPQ